MGGGQPGSGGVTVNVSVDGGVQGLLRSEAQIARMLARATAVGVRATAKAEAQERGAAPNDRLQKKRGAPKSAP